MVLMLDFFLIVMHFFSLFDSSSADSSSTSKVYHTFDLFLTLYSWICCLIGFVCLSPERMNASGLNAFCFFETIAVMLTVLTGLSGEAIVKCLTLFVTLRLRSDVARERIAAQLGGDLPIFGSSSEDWASMA